MFRNRQSLSFRVFLVTILLLALFANQAFAQEVTSNDRAVFLFDRVVEKSEKVSISGLPEESNIVNDMKSAASRIGVVNLNKSAAAPGALSANSELFFPVFEGEPYEIIINDSKLLSLDSASLRGSVEGSLFGAFSMSIVEGQTMVTLRIPEDNKLFFLVYSEELRGHYLFEVNIDEIDRIQGSPSALRSDIEIDKSAGQTLNPETLFQVDGQDQDKQSEQGRQVVSNNPEQHATIDVMVVYTPNARNWAGGAAGIQNVINIAMSFAQDAHTKSNTGVTKRLVHIAEVNYTETGDSTLDLHRLTFTYGTYDGHQLSPFLDEVAQLRNQHAADLVAMFSKIGDTGGVGWLYEGLSNEDEYGFTISRVQQVATGYTHIHEMGHNMGAHHHKLQTAQPGPNSKLNSYSAGWRFETGGTLYSTLMSYSEDYEFINSSDPFRNRTSTEIGYFSSPLVSFNGVQTGDATHGDNARTIRESKHIVAAYRSSTVGPVTSVSLSASPPNQAAPGQSVTLFAQATGGVNPEYAFSVRQLPNGAWQTLSSFGPGNTVIANAPPATGEYQFRVQARSSGSASVEAERTLNYLVTGGTVGPVTGVTISASPSGSSAPGQQVTFTAQATGGANPQYAFIYRVKGSSNWLIARHYSSANTFSYTPYANGQYQVGVAARSAGSTASYEALNYRDHTVGVQPVQSVSLSVNPPFQARPYETVTITAQAAGGVNPLYQFYYRLPGGSWNLLRSYSMNHVFVGYASGASNFDVDFGVIAKSSGSSYFYEAYRIYRYQIRSGPVGVDVQEGREGEITFVEIGN